MRYIGLFFSALIFFLCTPLHVHAVTFVIGSPNIYAEAGYSNVAQWRNGISSVTLPSGYQMTDYGRKAYVDESNPTRLSAMYHNIGVYQDRILDVKLEITSVKEFKGHNYSAQTFDGGRAIAFNENGIGIFQAGYERISWRLIYYYNDTGQPATDLPGSFITVNDIDGGQRFEFSDIQVDKMQYLIRYEGTQIDAGRDGSGIYVDSRTYKDKLSSDRRYAATMIASGYTMAGKWYKDYNGDPDGSEKPYYTPMGGYLNWKDQQWWQYFGIAGYKPVQTDPIPPTKKIKEKVGAADRYDVTHNDIAFPAKTFEYVFYLTVPYEESQFYYQAYTLTDTIHPSLLVDKSEIKIEDAQSSVGATDLRSRFDIDFDKTTNQLTLSGDKDKLGSGSFYGHTYRIRVPVKLDKEHDLTQYTDTDTYTFKNHVDTKITYSTGNKKSASSNKVSTTVTLPLTELSMQEMQIYTDKITKTTNLGVGADFNDGQDLRSYVTVQARNVYWMYSPDVLTMHIREKGKTSDAEIIGTTKFKMGDMVISKGKLKGKKLSTAKASDDGNPYEVELRVPIDLKKDKLIAKNIGDDDGRSYEARFALTKANEYHHEINDKRKLINTCGYTSSNKSITEIGGSFKQDTCEESTPKDVVAVTTLADGKKLVTYQRPIRTTRAYSGDTLGKVKKDNEMITVRFTPEHTVKSGYGYDMDFTVTYKNLFDTKFIESKFPGSQTPEDLDDDARYCGVPVKERKDDDCEIVFSRTFTGYNTYNNIIMDETHGAYKDDRSGTKVPASTTSSTKSYHEYNTVKDTAGLSGPKSDVISFHTYQAPLTYLEQRTDMSYNTAQKDAGAIKGKYINAGRFAYIPVWLKDKEAGTFVSTPRTYYPKFNPAIVASGSGLKEQRLGVNHVGFNIKKTLNIPANMWNYDQSTTPDDDQLLLQPATRSDDLFRSF